MERQIHPAVRYLSVLAICLAALLGTSAVVQADFTPTEAKKFDIVEASNSWSKWTTQGCTDEEDIDDGCYVEVRADSVLRDRIAGTTGDLIENKWANYFNDNCSVSNRDDYEEQNEEFDECWEDLRGEVSWPEVGPREYFEATGFCKSDDTSCSIRLNICYNANECDGTSGNDDEFDEDDGEMAAFFDDTRRCLFDVSNSRYTECINDGLKEVYDELQDQGRLSFDELEDRLEEMGVEIERYSSSVNNVEDRSYFGTEYRESSYRPAYKTRYTPKTPYTPYKPPSVQQTYRAAGIATSKPWIDQAYWPTISGYSPVSGGDFILVNFTQHLEAQPYTNICGTGIGCINSVGSSSYFSYMGNISIVITDRNTISCLRNRGYGIGRGTVLAFNDPNLQNCDRRVASANSYCPDCGEGAKSELLKMYNLGLLTSLLTPALAQGMQSDLARSAAIAPECLCSAGFRSGDLIIDTSQLTYQEQAAIQGRIAACGGGSSVTVVQQLGTTLGYSSASPSCQIKGNVNTRDGSRIYHVPGSTYYSRTQINTSEGDKYFCSVQDAEYAGFRAPLR